jgi:hypothetical protein
VLLAERIEVLTAWPAPSFDAFTGGLERGLGMEDDFA